MTSTIARPSPHIAGLDGLRALAVTGVVVYHLSPGYLPGGYLGVDIFFVISGFLITSLLLRERQKTGRIALGAFWARRARRLIPALVALVLVCGTAAWVIGGDVLLHLGRQVLGAATFSSNWLSIVSGNSYFDDTAPELFRNLWSLAVEEQFYLVWPLLLILLLVVRPVWLRAVIVGMLALASGLAMAALYSPGADATRVYYGTDTHSFGLAIGALLAFLLYGRSLGSVAARRMWPVLGGVALLALVAGCFLLPTSLPLVYRGGLVAISLATALTIVGSVTGGSPLGRILDLRPFRWVGRRSYGLYLWHWPVFVLVLAALPNWDRRGASGWVLGAIALAITVVAATLSYRFLETPIRRDGFRATLRRWAVPLRAGFPRLLAPAASGLVILVAAGFVAAAVIRDPGKSSAEQVIESGAKSIVTATPTPEPSVTAGPLQPPPPAGAQITAIGDSVMLASAPELENTYPGIAIDAVVSRQASAAPAILQQLLDSGELRRTVLIGLGTNGPIDPGVLDQVIDIIGPKRNIVVVNVQAPRGWVDGDNDQLGQFAQDYRNVELADWKDAIGGQLQLLARDQIHPGTRGGEVYVGAVQAAIQKLVNLPLQLPKHKQ